ncbi:hypothetical protein [Streptomyces clavuligerus]|uniref:Secreted protein n=1 Tax=Streptomyces clavuligerus TaxID=1901 RepID=B5GN18_STRCL|nr:hypothetical protein [Streptomyces clavuligerus]ANW22228.1 hypothetical protein BB341_28250 [Streptomyces clavuligerus]AXU17123.1 hypothetical protein D1794_31310 [Streptomyces clavuligerus]EDY47714.1 hypothetical protein SSCG_00742 [Streptomyces clavuligerus]EFG04293.1 Hypothetical protein SCLAV_p0807 [Streptomyces clavuligerus]MBY6307232.1 hypothetical protein [Streptomyces clavuligerus]
MVTERMRAAAVTVTAVALLPLAGPASAVAPAYEQTVLNDSCGVGNEGGRARLHGARSGSVGDDDYVALYNRNPHQAGPYGYLGGAWQWTAKGDYTTDHGMDGGARYWCARVGYDGDGEQHVILTTRGPFT